jgi:hypothetical protein
MTLSPVEPTTSSSAPKRENDTNGAAAAQSKDFGFSPGSMEWGWGGGTLTTPQGRREAPKGRHRRHGRTGRPRVSPGPKPTPPTTAFSIAGETPATRSSKRSKPEGGRRLPFRSGERTDDTTLPPRTEPADASPPTQPRPSASTHGNHQPQVDSASPSRAAALASKLPHADTTNKQEDRHLHHWEPNEASKSIGAAPPAGNKAQIKTRVLKRAARSSLSAGS